MNETLQPLAISVTQENAYCLLSSVSLSLKTYWSEWHWCEYAAEARSGSVWIFWTSVQLGLVFNLTNSVSVFRFQ